MNITKNFTLEELTNAPASFGNKAGSYEIANLSRLAEQVLQPLRDHVGKPIKIHSGYRCPEYNVSVGGAKNSEHLFGMAADISIEGYTNADIIEACVNLNLPFQQIIDEQLYRANGELHKWIHISCTSNPGRVIKTARNTKQNLTAIYTVIK